MLKLIILLISIAGIALGLFMIFDPIFNQIQEDRLYIILKVQGVAAIILGCLTAYYAFRRD
jgi:uncharacterized membrane protein HdeD (DUF308 family)